MHACVEIYSAHTLAAKRRTLAATGDCVGHVVPHKQSGLEGSLLVESVGGTQIFLVYELVALVCELVALVVRGLVHDTTGRLRHERAPSESLCDHGLGCGNASTSLSNPNLHSAPSNTAEDATKSGTFHWPLSPSPSLAPSRPYPHFRSSPLWRASGPVTCTHAMGRPLSKTVRFNVLQIVASAAGTKSFTKF